MPDTSPLCDWTSASAHKESDFWRGCEKDYVVILIERIVKSAPIQLMASHSWGTGMEAYFNATLNTALSLPTIHLCSLIRHASASLACRVISVKDPLPSNPFGSVERKIAPAITWRSQPITVFAPTRALLPLVLLRRGTFEQTKRNKIWEKKNTLMSAKRYG